MNPRPFDHPGVIRRWTLALEGPEDLMARTVERDAVAVRRVSLPLPAFNRFLHQAVGAEFRWDGRDDWSLEDWVSYAERPELETWVLYVQGTPAGYFETEYSEDGSARIHNFGLMRPFFGQGFGAHLLSFAARRAFERGAGRLWLQTCTKDHPHALQNYQARGFRVVREEVLPDTPA